MKPFKTLAAKRPDTWVLPCLYCGVDSGPVLQFFIWMIGAGLLAFFCFYAWGYTTGKFRSDESASRIPLDIEKDEANHGSPSP